MTMLRQSRWLRYVCPAHHASSLAKATVLGTGLLLPAAAIASPHSHSRHTLPTPLHTAAVSETGTHRAGKAHKGKTDAHPAAAPSPAAPAHHGGKRGKGRSHQAEPEDEPIPMYRAGHGGAPLSHHGQEVARGGRSYPAHSGFRSGPAPLASAYRHGGHQPVTVAAHEPVHVSEATLHPVRSAGKTPQWALAKHDKTPHALEPAEEARVAPAPTRPHVDAPAEGISHPDDDERLPRIRTAPTEESSNPAPIARVSAAPVIAPAAPSATQTPVVQGFGSEVTLPSAAGTDRPGGTRRRNHPNNWQPESLVNPPLPLEEREAITEAAISPTVIPEIYDRNGRLLMPAPLKGSHDVLVHQNLMATSDGLERVYDDADLERLRAAHMLVNFPVSESLRMNEDLPMNRRVARPWTVAFAADIAHAFYARFHQPLQINSAVRTVHFQAHLQLVNGNAAAITGEAASPHLTGQAIDFGKRGMNQAELAWMRGYLLPVMQAGKIDVEEEFQQSCFHISVYRSYTAARHITREFAQVHAAASETNDTATLPEGR